MQFKLYKHRLTSVPLASTSLLLDGRAKSASFAWNQNPECAVYPRSHRYDNDSVSLITLNWIISADFETRLQKFEDQVRLPFEADNVPRGHRLAI